MKECKVELFGVPLRFNGTRWVGRGLPATFANGTLPIDGITPMDGEPGRAALSYLHKGLEADATSIPKALKIIQEAELSETPEGAVN